MTSPIRKPASKSAAAARDRDHVDAMLDEALAQTFPASDPPAMLEPAPNGRCARVAGAPNVAALTQALADTFVLYVKTHGFHWNVVGRQFSALHKLFEAQYRDLWAALDEIAERIRALDAPAPASAARFRALSEIREADRVPPGPDMLRELVRDNETAAGTMRAGIAAAEAAGDQPSADLLTGRLAYHDKQIWMMRSMLGL